MAVLFKPYGSFSWEKEELKGLVDFLGATEGKTALSEAEITEKIGCVDILQADVDIAVTRRVLEQGKRLRAVLCTSIGVDYVDLEAATEKGVLVANNPDFCVVAVAEYTIGLMFALLRRIPQGIGTVKEGKWKERGNLVGVELFGKTLGVIGLGKTGREVGGRGRALGMKVVAYSPHAGASAAASVGAEYVSLEELLGRADIITIHTSLRKDTNKLIGERELALMKEGAYLINVARGGIVEEEALAKALTKGKLAGAALDVLSSEPPNPDNPLLKTGNVLITPHIAWSTAEAKVKTHQTFADQVKAVLQGEVPPHLLNPDALPRWEERIKNL